MRFPDPRSIRRERDVVFGSHLACMQFVVPGIQRKTHVQVEFGGIDRATIVGAVDRHRNATELRRVLGRRQRQVDILLAIGGNRHGFRRKRHACDQILLRDGDRRWLSIRIFQRQRDGRLTPRREPRTLAVRNDSFVPCVSESTLACIGMV